MRERDYYPAMSESQWRSAPFNEPYIPEKDFDVTCSQSLSRTTTVCTNNYIPVVDEGYEDGVGWHEEYADTSKTNWREEYSNTAYTPLEIIQKCGELCKYLLDRDMTDYGKNSLKKLMEECDGWTEDETEFCEG